MFSTSSIFVLQFHSSFEPEFSYVDFDGNIQRMSRILIILCVLVLASSLNDRKSSRDKANIHVGNLKGKQRFPPSTVNGTSAKCVQNSRWPPSRHIETGHRHTGRFNAMNIIMIIALCGILRDNQVNIMATDALTPRVAIFSSAVLLIKGSLSFTPCIYKMMEYCLCMWNDMWK